MKNKKNIFIFIALFLFSASFGQIVNYESLFKTMHKEQLKIAKSKKFTKTEVAAIDKAMLTAGKNINRALKAAPGETHQYLIDKIKKEFRSLNTQLGRALSGDKLSAFKRVSNSQQTIILRKLQSGYMGKSNDIRKSVRVTIRKGLRMSLMKGFGGDDPGW